jgi:hypothetical protein
MVQIQPLMADIVVSLSVQHHPKQGRRQIQDRPVQTDEIGGIANRVAEQSIDS